jgi:DNA (cytosine-5)-methyltransferase 1
MTRPRLLDLFCGAGGAAVGYHRAGFDVTGVDISPQPRYPFEFRQADAMTFPLDGYDAIHASPPCQDHSPLQSVAGIHGTGWMLDATLGRLARQPAPWIVENVAAARNRADFLLCGEMFGLRTVRHRRFTLDPRVGMLIQVPEHHRHRRPTSTKNRVSALADGHNLSVTGNIGRHAGKSALGHARAGLDAHVKDCSECRKSRRRCEVARALQAEIKAISQEIRTWWDPLPGDPPLFDLEDPGLFDSPEA